MSVRPVPRRDLYAIFGQPIPAALQRKEVPVLHPLANILFLVALVVVFVVIFTLIAEYGPRIVAALKGLDQ